MKRIGKLNNKIVVQGDPNLVKSNQILYKEGSNGIVLQERKQNNLENITAGGGSTSDGAFTYKSRKVVWEVDTNNEGLGGLFSMIMYLPFYCICIPNEYKIDKYYGLSTSTYLGLMTGKLQEGANNAVITYIEECECNVTINTQFGNINCNGSLLDFLKEMNKIANPDSNISDEEIINLLSSMGLTQTSYEDYIIQDVVKEYGSLTLK